MTLDDAERAIDRLVQEVAALRVKVEDLSVAQWRLASAVLVVVERLGEQGLLQRKEPRSNA